MRQALSSPASFIRYSRLREWSRWHGSFFHIIFFCSVFFLFRLFFCFFCSDGLSEFLQPLSYYGSDLRWRFWSGPPPLLLCRLRRVFFLSNPFRARFRRVFFFFPFFFFFLFWVVFFFCRSPSGRVSADFVSYPHFICF